MGCTRLDPADGASRISRRLKHIGVVTWELRHLGHIVYYMYIIHKTFRDLAIKLYMTNEQK